MFVKKISLFLLIVAALISILHGPFEADPQMEIYLYILLIICGAFIGFFNINKDQENKFLQASLVFVIGAIIFKEYLLESSGFQQILSSILYNIILFASAAMVATGLRAIGQMALDKNYKDQFQEELAQQEKLIRFVSTWNILIFFITGLLFILIIMRLFFIPTIYEVWFDFLIFIIWVVFLIDLFYIFSKFWNFKFFLKDAWLDIVAVIPLFVFHDFLYVLLFAKFSRMVKIVRIFTMFGGSSKIPALRVFEKLYMKIKNSLTRKKSSTARFQKSTLLKKNSKGTSKKKTSNKKKKK